jgi:hypothetical protein
MDALRESGKTMTAAVEFPTALLLESSSSSETYSSIPLNKV